MESNSDVTAHAASAILQDRSNTITIATYALTGTFVVFFIARQIMKAIVFRKLSLDDIFMLLATTFGTGLSVVTLILASKGFGVLGLLTIERANAIMKGYYTSNLLYISSLCFSKLSILVLFYNVVVLRAHRFFVLGFGIFICTWSAASAGAVAFQCGLPHPWEMMTLHCLNIRIFWAVYCSIDVSSEIFIVILSVDLVAHLRVRFSRKLTVVACFAPRLLVVSAALVRIVYLYQVTPHGDPEYDLWIPTVCTQAQVCASICTACILHMVPFFRGLQGNIWRSCSTRSWIARSRSTHMSGPPPNLLGKREMNIRFESPKSSTSLIKGSRRVSIVSPRIPSPIPVSPFMPPSISTHRTPLISVNVAASRETRGLSVSGTLYDSESDEMFDIVSLQTATCFAPSPIEAPVQAHLSNAGVIDVPGSSKYLAILDNLTTSSRNSYCSSLASIQIRPEPQPINSSSPQDVQQHMLSLPVSQKISSYLVQDIQSQSSTVQYEALQASPNVAKPHAVDDFAHHARSASSRSHPKFSVTPRLNASHPTTVSSYRA